MGCEKQLSSNVFFSVTNKNETSFEPQKNCFRHPSKKVSYSEVNLTVYTIVLKIKILKRKNLFIAAITIINIYIVVYIMHLVNFSILRVVENWKNKERKI